MIEIQNYEGKFILFVNKSPLIDFEIGWRNFFNPESNKVERFYSINSNGQSNKKISSFTIMDFPQLKEINFKEWASSEIYKIDISINRIISSTEISNKFEYNIKCLFTNNIQFSLNNYLAAFERIYKNFDSNNSININGFHELWGNYEIIINQKIEKLNIPIVDQNNYFVSLINQTHLNTIEYLKNEIGFESVICTFEFPDIIKYSCEQYLLYFAKFLQDLGIKTSSNLKVEAGKVLFSVTPTDDKQALEKIREALAVYLNLPASPIVYDDSFAAMRLKQQVDNLQHAQKMAEMEFRLATKVIESQDKIIQQKDLTIEQQSKIIEKITSKSIMIDSAENKEELEEIYEGIRVGESKWLKELTGVGLNPITAIKEAVKNTFGKDEKKTVLGLDAEE